MNKRLLFIGFSMMVISTAYAQDFITRGKIEFEVKRNNKRIYAADNDMDNQLMNDIPEFDISYRDLIFSGNRSIYQPGRKGATAFDYENENSVFIDIDKQKCIQKREQVDQYYVYEDTLKSIKWKIGQETRKILGWQCRKAVGVIYDSVYVVAFYCPEIIPQGGPELFSGLPGMILGLAIPRYYTTWFATKIEVADIDESKIVAPSIKKSKQYTKKEMVDILLKKYKEAGWGKDMTPEKLSEMLSEFEYTL
jgi:GLPGLI family protein